LSVEGISYNHHDFDVNLVRAEFFENNKTYTFEIASGGNGVKAEISKDVSVSYGGKRFIRRTFFKEGNPFFISIIPNDPTFTLFNHIEINLPSINRENYINILNQILSTFIFINSN